MQPKNPCEYVFASANAMMTASKNASLFNENDFLSSLTLIHKAWNNLWQSDVIYSQNGKLSKPSSDFLFGIEVWLRNDGETGYEKEKGLLFKEDKGGSVVKNVNLFKHLRNQVVHEYLPVEFQTLHDFIIPYMRANFLNYCNAYTRIYNHATKFPNNCRKNETVRGHSDCKNNKLPTPELLRKSLVLPTSMFDLKRNTTEQDSCENAYNLLPNELKKKIKGICESRVNKIDEEVVYFIDYLHDHRISTKEFSMKPKAIAAKLSMDSSFPFVFTWAYIRLINQTNNYTSKNKITGEGKVSNHARELVRWVSTNECFMYSYAMVQKIKEQSKDIHGNYDSKEFALFVGISPDNVKIK